MIRVENVFFKYKNNNFTLEVPLFTVKKGQTVLIKGYNGSGKTTFLKLLAGILKPLSGFVKIDEVNTDKYNEKIYTKVGYLRQQPEPFFSITVKELIIMGQYPYTFSLKNISYSSIKRCVQILRSLQLYHLKDRYIDELSSGQLQMCFWGKLLYQNPAIFLLDEPFNNLDDKNTEIVSQQMKNMKSDGKIFIISTHRHAYYEIEFDAIYEFKDGKIYCIRNE